MYGLAVDVADLLHAEVVQWPSFAKWTVGVQLVRAADSIGANIAEALGRWHPADKRRLLTIARGPLYETEHWIDCARTRRLLQEKPDLTELGRTLNGLIKRPTPEPRP